MLDVVNRTTCGILRGHESHAAITLLMRYVKDSLPCVSLAAMRCGMGTAGFKPHLTIPVRSAARASNDIEAGQRNHVGYGDESKEMRDRLGGIEPATEMDEHREIQAELDAAAFHAYGLDRDQPSSSMIASIEYRVLV